MIREPIILSSDGGAQVFRTKEQAEQFAEPVDIRNGEFVAYDATGMLLMLEEHSHLYRGVLSEPEVPEDRGKELAVDLRALLRAISQVNEVSYAPSQLDEMDLGELVRLGLEYDAQ